MSNTNNFLVSILVPVFNVEPYVERCCRSLFEQTYENLEFVFVDDCSTDNSINIIEQVSSEYPSRRGQIQIVRHQKNRGLAASRNTALEVAKGDFLMLVDSDDWIEHNAVELLLQRQLQTNADIVYGQTTAHYQDYDEDLIEPYYNNKEEMILHSTRLVVDHVLWKRLYRRSLFVDNGIRWKEGWDYGEDHYMLPQLYWYANKIERIDTIIYHYNRWKVGKESPVIRKIWKMWSNELEIIDALISFFAGKDKIYVDSLYITKVDCLLGCMGQSFAHRTRNKYNELASILYAIPEQYLSQAKFNSADERVLYRYYDSRLIYRAIVKIISKIYVGLGVKI